MPHVLYRGSLVISSQKSTEKAGVWSTVGRNNTYTRSHEDTKIRNLLSSYSQNYLGTDLSSQVKNTKKEQKIKNKTGASHVYKENRQLE